MQRAWRRSAASVASVVALASALAAGTGATAAGGTGAPQSRPAASRAADAAPTPSLGPFMRGMTYAAYSRTVFATRVSDRQVREMAAAGVNYVSVQVAWFQPTATSTTIAPGTVPGSQTPTDGSLVHLIRLIHELGMHVFLDPFVNATTGEAWQGTFHPTSWPAWFAAYDRMVAHYARLAQANGVELLALGDENDSSDHDPSLLPYYLQMVRVARRYYHGPLTYGADYPDYQQVPVAFWRALDAIGIEAYFPLADTTDPTQAQLDAAWRAEAQQIDAWRASAGLGNEPVIITELGYYSGDTTAESPGQWNAGARLDLGLQVKCYQAVFDTIYQEPWLAGIFWFWWANPSDGPDWPPLPTNNGYNVQNKPVLGLIARYFRAPDGGRQPVGTATGADAAGSAGGAGA